MTTDSATETVPSAVTLDAVLTEIAYALWLSRRLAAEIRAEKYPPARPAMAEFCAVDMAACAA
jgi:hypothetical protein